MLVLCALRHNPSHRHQTSATMVEDNEQPTPMNVEPDTEEVPSFTDAGRRVDKITALQETIGE